jgi:hypothetical protein
MLLLRKQDEFGAVSATSQSQGRGLQGNKKVSSLQMMRRCRYRPGANTVSAAAKNNGKDVTGNK